MIVNKDELTEKKVRILDKQISIFLTDENQAGKFFNFSELDSKWHEKKIGQYHFSQLIGCLREYYFFFKYDRELSPEQKGIYYVGKVWHEKIQSHLEKTYGFVMIEVPLVDEIDDEIEIIGKADVVSVLEHGIFDIKTTRYMPVLMDLSPERFEENYGKYVLQVLAYAFFLNNTYFKIDPIEKIAIILVDKNTCYVKLMVVDYDDELGKYFYLKIRERARYLHECILENKLPEQYHLDRMCQYCSFLDLCKEGSEFVYTLNPPVIFEANEYKKRYEGKKAYWKFDHEKKVWIKTKGFVEFLKKELGYSDEQIKNLP